MSDILDTLRQEGVDPALLTAVQEYRAAHPLSEALRPRIPAPAFTYYGKEVPISLHPLSLNPTFQKSVGRASAFFTQKNFQIPFRVM